MKYIVVYNVESDFFLVRDTKNAAEEIATLIEDGYAQDDIQLYKTEEVEFELISKPEVKVKELKK